MEYDVHVLDVVTTGPKPDLVRGLGATDCIREHASTRCQCSGVDTAEVNLTVVESQFRNTPEPPCVDGCVRVARRSQRRQ